MYAEYYLSHLLPELTTTADVFWLLV